MRIRRSKSAIVIAITIVSIGLAIVPSTIAASAASGKGSNPGSAFCKLEKATLAVNSPTSAKEKAGAKALEAGNWKVAQKDLLAIQGQTGKLVQQLTADLSSAPANVQAAARQSIKFIPAETNAIKNSTSAAQFEAAIQKATSGAKFQKAATILETYETSQCGIS
jgi:hypothetical protein